jgi:hypothetical protein
MSNSNRSMDGRDDSGDPLTRKQLAKRRWWNTVPNKFFDGYDEREFYPTLEFKFVKDETGHLIGALQLFRKREHPEVAEWRECQIIQV